MAHRAPMPVRIPPENLPHFLARHCQYQNPAEHQYRDDFLRVFGEDRIHPLEQPAGDPNPFIARSLELIAEAVTRGQYVTCDEHTAGGTYQHTGAAVLTRPGVEFVLRHRPDHWNMVSAFFTHKSDLGLKTFRDAVRQMLYFYTDRSLRLPNPTFRVWANHHTGPRYRTNIRFGDPKAWGEDDGRFDLNCLPPW
jgi:DNA-binding transcriptional LysR family regulator